MLEEIIDEELGTMDTNDARKVIADAFTRYKHKLLHLLVQHECQDFIRSAFASGIRTVEGEEYLPLRYEEDPSDIHVRLRDGALFVIHKGIPSTTAFDAVVTQSLCVPFVVRRGDEHLLLDEWGSAITIGGETTFDAVSAWNQHSLLLEKNGAFVLSYHGDLGEQNTSPWLCTLPVTNTERGVLEALNLEGEPVSLTPRFHLVPSDYQLEQAFEASNTCKVYSNKGANLFSLQTGRPLAKVWFSSMEQSRQAGMYFVGLPTLDETTEGVRTPEVQALWIARNDTLVIPPRYEALDYPSDRCHTILEGKMGESFDVYTWSTEGDWEIVVHEAREKKYFQYGKENAPRKTGRIYSTPKEVVILREDGELWARVRGRVLQISADYTHPVTLITSRGSALQLQGTSDEAEFEKITISKEYREFLQNPTFSCTEEETRLD